MEFFSYGYVPRLTYRGRVKYAQRVRCLKRKHQLHVTAPTAYGSNTQGQIIRMGFSAACESAHFPAPWLARLIRECETDRCSAWQDPHLWSSGHEEIFLSNPAALFQVAANPIPAVSSPLGPRPGYKLSCRCLARLRQGMGGLFIDLPLCGIYSTRLFTFPLQASGNGLAV